jgi:hypothetical protein
VRTDLGTHRPRSQWELDHPEETVVYIGGGLLVLILIIVIIVLVLR